MVKRRPDNRLALILAVAATAVLIAGCGKKKAEETTATATEAGTDTYISETTLSQSDSTEALSAEPQVYAVPNADGTYTISSLNVGSAGVKAGTDFPAGPYLVTTAGTGVFSVRKTGQDVSEMQANVIGDNADIGQQQYVNQPFQFDEGDAIFMSSHDEMGLVLTFTPAGAAAPAETPEETMPAEENDAPAETMPASEEETQQAWRNKPARTAGEGVAHVTEGLDQISAVVQTNSATSEESAATSEELASQATTMKNLIGRFNLKG